MPKAYSNCQDLWRQFQRTEKARNDCAEVLNLANREGEKHYNSLKDAVSRLSEEAQAMEEYWEKSFVTLPDDRRIFAEDYDWLDSIHIDWEEAGEASRAVQLDSGGRVYWLILDNKVAANVESVAGISRLTGLKGLYLDKDDGFQDSDEMFELKNLIATGFDRRHFRGNIDRVVELPSIERLSLHGYESADLGFLEKLPNLNDIHFFGNVIGDEPLVFSDFTFLEGCDALKNLTFLYYTFGTDDFSPIGKLPALTNLEIENCENSPTDLNFLRNHPTLESVRLDNLETRKQDEGKKKVDVSALLNIPTFNFLSIQWTQTNPGSETLRSKGIVVVDH